MVLETKRSTRFLKHEELGTWFLTNLVQGSTVGVFIPLNEKIDCGFSKTSNHHILD